MSLSVSIVIPAYNAALLIRRCIQSILDQRADFQIEVIVVDDASTDETIALVKGVNDHRITVLSQKNQGPAAARNIGLEKAAGKYLAFLDADDYWKPEFLKRTVDFLESNPDTIAVSVGQVHKSLGKPPVIAPRFLQDNSYPSEPQVLDSFFAFWAEHNHVCTGSVLMRTGMVRKTGGQRTEFRICEDLEFWAYLATFGKWGFVPEVLFVSDGGVATRKQGWLEKNKLRWASAPAVEQWQKRIVERINAKDLDSFKAARGRIAKNLAYSMILSHRDMMAKQAIAYVDGAMTDRVGSMLKDASCRRPFVWKMACSALRLREFARDKRLRLQSLWKKCR